MSAIATPGFDSPTAVKDTAKDIGSMSVALDDAFASVAVGNINTNSAFGHDVLLSAKASTDQHVAAGNLPNLAITQNG